MSNSKSSEDQNDRDSLYDSCNPEKSSDSTDSNEALYRPNIMMHITSKIIEKEIQSFLTYFGTSHLTDSVPILLFPQKLGQLIYKCIRYYAAICNLAAFYIEIHGVKVLAACNNNFLKRHYLNHYKASFLSLPEDCEHISITHLYNCIIKNKDRNKLRRNLSSEFHQDDLISEYSFNKPFAFLSTREFKTSRASLEEENEQDSKDDLVMKSSLNVNAQEFVPQSPVDNSDPHEDNEWAIPDEMPIIYSFLPMFSTKTDKDVTRPYLFTPDPDFKDFSYNATYFTFGSTESSSTTGISLDLPQSPKISDGSTQLDANNSQLRNNTSYFLMKPLEELVLISSPGAEPGNQKSPSDNALISSSKDTKEQVSLASLPQYPSDRFLATSSPMYFTSTPNPNALLTYENVPPFMFSYFASASTISNTLPLMKLETPSSDDPSSPTPKNSPLPIASVEQPSSSRSFSDGSTTQSYENYAQPLRDTTPPSSCVMLFSNINLNTKSSSSDHPNQSSSSTTQTSTFESCRYYTAEAPANSHFFVSSPSLPENIADRVPTLCAVETSVDFETPLAPTRSAPQLKLVTVPKKDSRDTSNVESVFSSSNSPVETTTTSKFTSITATISTNEKSETPGEFSSPTNTTSEQVDHAFMGGPKNYVDYIIEYKSFLEQASNYINGNPILVKSLRNVEDFKFLMTKEKSIIELYNIPDVFKTLDILRVFHEEPRCLIWCDNSHAILVSQSPAQAKRALTLTHQYIKSRPIVDASPVATVIACSYDLETMFETLDNWIEDSYYR